VLFARYALRSRATDRLFTGACAEPALLAQTLTQALDEFLQLGGP
jgi:hypothetical protein